jgi:hypothetical protein
MRFTSSERCGGEFTQSEPRGGEMLFEWPRPLVKIAASTDNQKRLQVLEDFYHAKVKTPELRTAFLRKPLNCTRPHGNAIGDGTCSEPEAPRLHGHQLTQE